MQRTSDTKYLLELTVNKEQRLNYGKILAKAAGHSRSTIEYKELKEKLMISIKAKDATALRASVNSILRDLQVIESISKKQKGH